MLMKLKELLQCNYHKYVNFLKKNLLLIILTSSNLLFPVYSLSQSVLVLKFFYILNLIKKIKEDAGREVVRIARYLNEDELGTQILVKVINMAHDELNEENKMVAVQLLGRLSDTFGQSLTESFVAFEILSLGEDVK